MSEFDELLNELTKRMTDQGHPVKIVSKDRTAEEQQKLYSQGRSSGGHIVTEKSGLPGEESRHQMGLAADFGFANPNDQSWDLLGKNAKDLGLTWGGDWKTLVDRPHVEMTQMPEQTQDGNVVIVDAEGGRHVFPPGMDPKKAAFAVKKTLSERHLSEPSDYLTGAVKSLVDTTVGADKGILNGLTSPILHPINTFIKAPLAMGKDILYNHGQDTLAGIKKVVSGDPEAGGNAIGGLLTALAAPRVPKMVKGAADAGGAGVMKVASAAGNVASKAPKAVVGGVGGGIVGSMIPGIGPFEGALTGAALMLGKQGASALGWGKAGRLAKLGQLLKAETGIGEAVGGEATSLPEFAPEVERGLAQLRKSDPNKARVVEQALRDQNLKNQPQQQNMAGPLKPTSTNLVDKIEAQDAAKAQLTQPPVVNVEYTPQHYAADIAHMRARGQEIPPELLKLAEIQPPDTPAPTSGLRVGPDRPYTLDEMPPNVQREVPSARGSAELPGPKGGKIKFEKAPSKVDPRTMDEQQGLYKGNFRQRSFSPLDTPSNPIVEALGDMHPVASHQPTTLLDQLQEGYKGTLPEEISGPVDMRKSLSLAEQNEWGAFKRAHPGVTEAELHNWLAQRMLGRK